ncbi:MAG: Holliday junction branch migration protein RuvA, partial [Patescibacteria group bacterium]
MISQLEGKIAHKEIGFVILDVSGVGYKVHTGISDVGNEGETVRLWTHLSVREDALDLYGFEERSELEFFEDLIKISGIGPKTALSILSLAPMQS